MGNSSSTSFNATYFSVASKSNSKSWVRVPLFLERLKSKLFGVVSKSRRGTTFFTGLVVGSPIRSDVYTLIS
jgi:hypothetical protein